MRLFIFLLFIIFLTNCSKPKTVLICGDHVCVNKAEAELFFEKNLSIEVKIIDKKNDNELDLVELNLKRDSIGNKEISVVPKNTTDKKIKALSNEEIVKIKRDIKNKRDEKKLVKKIINKEQKVKKEKKYIEKINKIDKKKNNKINVNKKRQKVVDVCTIIEKCSIDEISKYLLDNEKKKKFPNLNTK